MFFDPDKLYNDLPLLPPKAEIETKAVPRKAIAADGQWRSGGIDSEPGDYDQLDSARREK